METSIRAPAKAPVQNPVSWLFSTVQPCLQVPCGPHPAVGRWLSDGKPLNSGQLCVCREEWVACSHLDLSLIHI